jgi:hypothetical protein
MLFSTMGRCGRAIRLPVLIASVVALAGLARPARAGLIQFNISNLTASAGDPVYDVATDVTFQSFQLQAVYSGGANVSVPLPSSTLDTLTIFEDSSSFSVPNANGNLLSATLIGTLSTTALQKEDMFGGPITNVTAGSPRFSATLTNFASSNSVNILITDTAGDPLSIGTFAVTLAPEPASVALFGMGALLVGFLRIPRKKLAETTRPAVSLVISGLLLVPSAALQASSIDATNWGMITAPVYGTSEAAPFAGAELFAGPNKFGSYYAGVLPSGAMVKPAGASIQIGMNPLGLALTPDGRYIVSTNDDEREGGFASLQSATNVGSYTLSVVDTTTMTVVSQISTGGKLFIGLKITGPGGGPYTVWASGGGDNSVKLFDLSGTGAISVSNPAGISILPTLPHNQGYVSNYSPVAGLSTASTPTGFSAAGAKSPSRPVPL